MQNSPYWTVSRHMSVIHLVFKVKLLHFRKKRNEEKGGRGGGRKEEEASIPVCKAAPPPTLSLPRRKGFVCAVRTLIIEFINTHRPRDPGLGAARVCPPPSPFAGCRVVRAGGRNPAHPEPQPTPAAEEEEDAALPGTRGRGADLGGTPRAPAAQ